MLWPLVGRDLPAGEVTNGFFRGYYPRFHNIPRDDFTTFRLEFERKIYEDCLDDATAIERLFGAMAGNAVKRTSRVNPRDFSTYKEVATAFDGLFMPDADCKMLRAAWAKAKQ